ncbi:hypothetical protein Mpsy_1042 [Methanolobus psychrophilus R15]|nr:hypothetical protein Mpsy_1042 [Methanolobus psychrophilus R15]
MKFNLNPAYINALEYCRISLNSISSILRNIKGVKEDE